MHTLVAIGQLICLTALAYGAWLCFVHAGRYDADSLHADRAASRNARTRGHVSTPETPEPARLDMAA